MPAFLAQGKGKRIVCGACGWTNRVAPSDVAREILYHRDVTCSRKLEPPTRQHATTRRGSMHGLSQRVKRPTRPRCPTCRESLALVNGAYACVTGCTNEPTMR